MLSGEKKHHTHTTQVAVDETTGRIVDVRATVPGPTADLTLLNASGLLDRLPPSVGGLGDLAYVDLAALHPQGLGATPCRKPRPLEDVLYNRAFARRRIIVEHTSGRMRCFQAVTQRDRHHRQHAGRVYPVAGLVNRCVGRKGR